MNIEARGCSTRNKGAELLLVAIAQHFAMRNRIRLAVDHWFGSYEERAKYGLRTVLGATKFGRSAIAIELMPASFRNAYGLVKRSEVERVLDASGFAFGDQHGPAPAERLLHETRALKRRGGRLVLLPQAFGPFTQDRLRTAMAGVVELAELVYARDEESLAHLQGLDCRQETIRKAPDITLGVKAEPEPDERVPDQALCLVPNTRMLDKTDQETAEAYTATMRAILNRAGGMGLEPIILVHDAGEDIVLARELAQGSEARIVQELDPLRLKGLLGRPQLVVGSRFHALVASLSQGVPTLGIGWSHKYEELFNDFGCGEFCLRPPLDPERILDKLDELGPRVAGDGFRSLLAAHAAQQRALVEEMWREVDRALQLDDGAS